MTYNIWDKLSRITDVDPFAASGPQIDSDDFLIFRDENNRVVAFESAATLRAVFGYEGTLDDIAAAHMACLGNSAVPPTDEQRITTLEESNAELQAVIDTMLGVG